MVTFPSLSPSSRAVTQGQYAVKRFNSISGTGTTRVYGSQPFNAAMDLEFSNISDLDALLIVEAYEDARGSATPLTLPSALWTGMADALRVRLQRDYTWRFLDQPKITSAVPGVSSISITLEGQRDG